MSVVISPRVQHILKVKCERVLSARGNISHILDSVHKGIVYGCGAFVCSVYRLVSERLCSGGKLTVVTVTPENELTV